MQRSYDDLLDKLSSLIAHKNRADAGTWRDAFENMATYLDRLGMTEDLQRLRVIHVAGTKGKGSTCAMVESILRQCGYRTGLYTSPHLIDVRERVRIDGVMVDRDAFERQFWWCYDRFEKAATPEVGIPGYFRFMTLLALKIFLSKGVDVVVLEVGVGGRLDATNIIPNPVVCGITSLGMDHMEMLGDTLPKIAREKAGIFKRGRPAFTSPQPDDAMEALQEVAAKVGTTMVAVGPLTHVSAAGGAPPKLSLGGAHMVINAGLAVQLAAEFERLSDVGRSHPTAATRLSQLDAGVLPAEYARGLATVQWPGRSQVVEDPVLAAEAAAAHKGQGEPGAMDRGQAAISPVAERGAAGNLSAGGSGGAGAEVEHVPSWPQANGASTSAIHSAAGGAAVGTSVAAPSTRGSGSSGGSVNGRLSRLTFFIDGAHTPESMATCAEWFAEQAVTTAAGAPWDVRRVLLFNCMKERDPSLLLPTLARGLALRGVHFHHALFVPPDSQYGFLPTSKNSTASPQPPISASVPSVPSAATAAPSSTVSLAPATSRTGPITDVATPHTAAGMNVSGTQDSASALPSSPTVGPDLSWQAHMQQVWESQSLGPPMATPVQSPPLPPSALLPSSTSSRPHDSWSAAVIPSLTHTVEWLRQYARSSPRVQLQVLVSGSLYLVGDVLRLLGKLPK